MHSTQVIRQHGIRPVSEEVNVGQFRQFAHQRAFLAFTFLADEDPTPFWFPAGGIKKELEVNFEIGQYAVVTQARLRFVL